MTLFFRFVGACFTISAVAQLLLIVSYVLTPSLRKHPTSMVFYLALCDIGLASKFALTSLVPDSVCLQYEAIPCAIQAFFGQFAAVGSILWNGVIA